MWDLHGCSARVLGVSARAVVWASCVSCASRSAEGNGNVGLERLEPVFGSQRGRTVERAAVGLDHDELMIVVDFVAYDVGIHLIVGGILQVDGE